MNKENASKLWKIIQEAGDYLKGQLPDHPNHPKGRNPYAHVEGIIRRNSATTEYAARFALKCLRYQKRNKENE